MKSSRQWKAEGCFFVEKKIKKIFQKNRLVFYFFGILNMCEKSLPVDNSTRK